MPDAPPRGPVSESPRDAEFLELVEVESLDGLTDNVGGARGVTFIRGKAQNGCPRWVAQQLVGNFGERSMRIVGPWPPAPATPDMPTEPPVDDRAVTPAPSTGAIPPPSRHDRRHRR